MNMTAFQAFLATALIACSVGLAGLAHAADATPAAASCVPLAADPQIVRAGADKNVLLRSGNDHYIVHFRSSCQSASLSRRLDFKTDGAQATQLCSDGRSALSTDRTDCAISSVEPIDAEQFKREVRRRR